MQVDIHEMPVGSPFTQRIMDAAESGDTLTIFGQKFAVRTWKTYKGYHSDAYDAFSTSLVPVVSQIAINCEPRAGAMD